MLLFRISICLALASCAISGGWTPDDSVLKYRAYVDENVVSAQLLERGRNLLTLKVLPVNAKLMELQSTLSPSFFLRVTEDVETYVAALTISGHGDFGLSDVRFFLNDSESSRAREITDAKIIERHYPYAYPHYRVFQIEFSALSAGPRMMKVHLPMGPLAVRLPDIAEGAM